MAGGRPPKPTHLKVLQGTARPNRMRNEPKPAPVRPTCPRWLSPEAKREWRRVAPELEKLGLLTRVDRAALAAYCQAYARWRQAEEVLEREGLTCEHTNKAGATNVSLRPEFFVAQKYLQVIKGFCVGFGLTPSARARMTVPGTEREEGPVRGVPEPWPGEGSTRLRLTPRRLSTARSVPAT